MDDKDRDVYGLEDSATGGSFCDNARAREEGNVVYTASVFGDRMLFRVQSKQNRLLWDTLSIVEKVAGLTPLPTGANNIITHTSSERHHSLANSNLGQRDIVAAIIRTVHSYAEEYGMASDVFLAVVDMSLPFGGLFDISGLQSFLPRRIRCYNFRECLCRWTTRRNNEPD